MDRRLFVVAVLTATLSCVVTAQAADANAPPSQLHVHTMSVQSLLEQAMAGQVVLTPAQSDESSVSAVVAPSSSSLLHGDAQVHHPSTGATRPLDAGHTQVFRGYLVGAQGRSNVYILFAGRFVTGHAEDKDSGLFFAISSDPASNRVTIAQQPDDSFVSSLPHEKDFHEPVRVQETGHESDTNNQPTRRRRDGGADQCCVINVDLDKTFYDKFGVGSSKAERVHSAALVAVALMDGVSEIYADNFDRFSICLGAISVVTDPSVTLNQLPEDVSAGQILSNYQEWVATREDSGFREFGPVERDGVCLNHLFTARTPQQGIAGLSVVASPEPGVVGGICDRRRIGNKAFNTGFTTTRWRNPFTPDVQIVDLTADYVIQTTAHEFGHAFGAAHTCCSSSSCSAGTSCQELEGSLCNPAGIDKYIMHPFIRSGRNRHTFSPCSHEDVDTLLDAKASCLRPKISTLYISEALILPEEY